MLDELGDQDVALAAAHAIEGDRVGVVVRDRNPAAILVVAADGPEPVGAAELRVLRVCEELLEGLRLGRLDVFEGPVPSAGPPVSHRQQAQAGHLRHAAGHERPAADLYLLGRKHQLSSPSSAAPLYA